MLLYRHILIFKNARLVFIWRTTIWMVKTYTSLQNRNITLLLCGSLFYSFLSLQFQFLSLQFQYLYPIFSNGSFPRLIHLWSPSVQLFISSSYKPNKCILLDNTKLLLHGCSTRWTSTCSKHLQHVLWNSNNTQSFRIDGSTFDLVHT